MRSGGRRTALLALVVVVGLGCVLVPAALVLLVPLLFWTSGDAVEPAPLRAGDGTIVLVAVDDLRRDHLAGHGHRFDAAPTLTALARRGMSAADYVPASTATGPSLAALLTGRGPTETGFTSARALGAHRLPAAAETLAERFSAAGWRTAAALALPQDAGRLSGLAQGFEDVLGGPPGGPPLAAGAAVEGLLAIAREGGARGGLFALLHLGDLRADAEPALDPERLAAWLGRHLAPFRAGDAELAAELDRLRAAPGAAAARIEALVGRKRGSAAWLALQEARYDARLAALDDALDALLRGLADLGRDDPLVVVAGTRGRLLGVEPPADGPPIALSEALLRTALVAAGPGVDAARGDWRAVDRPGRVAALLRSAPSSGPPAARDAAAGGARLVAAPGLAWLARVDAGHKDVFARDGRRTCFDRARDRPAPEPCDAGAAPAGAGGAGGWELALSPPEGGGLALRLGSAAGDLLAVAGDADAASASPSGKSADVRASRDASVRVVTATGREPLTLTLALPAGGAEPAIVDAGPGGRGASAPLVAFGVPVLPARPVGDEAAPAAVVALEADGAWTRVRVTPATAGARLELALWLVPPGDAASAPEVELSSGAARLETFAGLGAVRAVGAGPLELRVRRGGGQSLAVAATLDGTAVPPRAMTSDRGGDAASLALYLPPVDVGAFAIEVGGATVLRARGAAAGLPLEPPYGLTEADVRLLQRLGPLE